MAEIQKLPLGRIAFILGYKALLDGDVARCQLDVIRHRQTGQGQHFRIGDHRVLDAFGQAVGDFPLGQGVQRRCIAQHQRRLPEGPAGVFAAGQIDGRLAAHAAVHHGKQGGGKLHIAHAAQIGGGGKAAQVARHAPAQGDQDVLARQIARAQKIQQLLVGLHVFAFLAMGKGEFGRVKARAMQAFQHLIAVKRVHRIVRYQHGAAGGQHAGNLLPGAVKQPRRDQRVIGTLGADGQRSHVQILSWTA